MCNGQVIREHDRGGAVVWPEHSFPPFEAEGSLRLSHDLVSYLRGTAVASGGAAGGSHRRLPHHLRPWLTLREGPPSSLRAVRYGVTAEADELSSLTQMPLQAVDLTPVVVRRTREERGLPLLAARLPFDLSKHSAVRSELARAMLRRLDEDMRAYAASQNAGTMPQLLAFCDGELASCAGCAESTAGVLAHVRSLGEQLVRLQRRDMHKLVEMTSQAVASANALSTPDEHPALAHAAPELGGSGGMTPAEAERRGAFALARLCGSEAHVTFARLVQLMLSSNAEAEIAQLNPYAGAEQVSRALELASLACLTANRIGQLQRCLVQVRDSSRTKRDPIPSRPIPSYTAPSRPIPSYTAPPCPIPSRPIPSRPVPSRPIPHRPIPSHPAPPPSHPRAGARPLGARAAAAGDGRGVTPPVDRSRGDGEVGALEGRRARGVPHGEATLLLRRRGWGERHLRPAAARLRVHARPAAARGAGDAAPCHPCCPAALLTCCCARRR